eukprot:5064389-Pyramimonas_sp.AAC.1
MQTASVGRGCSAYGRASMVALALTSTYGRWYTCGCCGGLRPAEGSSQRTELLRNSYQLRW